MLISAISYLPFREDRVRIPAGATTVLDLQLTVDPIVDRGIEVTVGGGPGAIKDAASGIGVKYETEIEELVAVSPVEHLRAVRASTSSGRTS